MDSPSSASPDAAESIAGRTLGEFVVGEPLASGGFGHVYRARQLVLEREAVVKVLRPERNAGVGARAAFLKEARLASKLDHPFAAHIYAFGAEPDGLLWIAMEFVRGTPLSELLERQGPLSVERFVALMERICEVVQSAHELGIIHRDIKPDNVMVISRAGRLSPKLLDFGTASWFVSSQSEAEAPDSTAVGSPHYMAPEQWINAAPAAGSDIYALGVLSFECLTGNVPFEGELTDLSRLHAVQPLPELGDGLPAALDEVLARATAKHIEERFPSAVAFAAALRTAAKPAEVSSELPQVESALRELFVSEGPQPIADTLTGLEAARSSRQAFDALRKLTRACVRYLGALALASRARLGPGASADSAEVRALFQKLHQDGLSDAEWYDLGAELCRPFLRAHDAHLLPELVSFFFEESGASSPRSGPLRQLLRMLAQGAPNDARPLDELGAAVRETTRLLHSVEFLVEYPLVVGCPGGVERWNGASRLHRRIESLPHAHLSEGHALLLSREGGPLLSLWPFAQVFAPTPSAPAELFLLEGGTRFGAKLLSFPIEFERHDEELWGWFAKQVAMLDDGPGAESRTERTPYRGLASFTATEADDFVGREKEVEAFLNRLRLTKFSSVVGPSGSGKSSFVQAGVVPRLPPGWSAITVRPGPSPLRTLGARLGLQGTDLGEFPAKVEASPAWLEEQLAPRLGAQKGLLLVVDQFEELLTLCHDSGERIAYAKALIYAAEVDERIRVIVTLRDDFLIRMQQVGPLRDRLATGLQLLGTPVRDDLIRILMEPARRAGYAMEDALLPEEMVDAVAEQPGALALLSFTALRLWELRDRELKRLTRRAYKALGGVGGALAQHAEEVVARLDEGEQRHLREAMRALITAEGTRAVLSRSELEQLLGRGPDAATLIEKLIAARLLVASEGVGGEDRIEVIHETLLSSWPRLVKWQREDAEAARMRDQLRSAARQWHERSRSRGVLWRGEALLEYRLWKRRHALPMTDMERAFVEASLHEESRGRRLRYSALGLVILGLAVGVLLLWRANTRAARSNREAIARLAKMHFENGRLELIAGRPLQALVYLSQALGEGAQGPDLEYLIARASRSAGAEAGELHGHARSIAASAISPDGSHLATASSDGTARLWSWTGEQVALLGGHSGAVLKIAFDQSGAVLATASADRTIRVWDARSGATLRVLTGHERIVSDLSFSPDGSRIASVGYDGTLRLWSWREGKLERTVPVNETGVGFVQYSPDGTRLVTGPGLPFANLSDRAARLWNAQTGDQVATLDTGGSAARSSTFAPGGHTLWIGSMDGSLCAFDATTGSRVRGVAAHSGAIDFVDVNGDGTRVATAGEDKTARVWEAATGKLLATLSGHEGGVQVVRFSPDASRLATGSEDGRVKLWLLDGEPIATFSGHLSMVTNVLFSHDGQRLVSSGIDPFAKLWNAQATDYEASIGSQHPIWRASYDSSGRRLMLVSQDPERFFRSVDSSSGKVLEQLEIPGLIETEAWQQRGDRILVTHHEPHPTLDAPEIVEFPGGRRVAALNGHSAQVTEAAFDPSGRLVATGDQTGRIRLWNAASGDLRFEVQAHEGVVDALAFTPDGQRLLSGGQDGLGKIWSVDDGRLLLTLRGHQSSVWSIAASPDGRWVATGSNDQTVGLWDAQSGALRYRFEGHRQRVSSVAFSPDGNFVASGAVDGTARLWGNQTGRLLDVWSLGQPVTAVGFAPDGHRVVTAGEGGALLLWDVAGDTRTNEQLSTFTRCHVPYELVDEHLLPRRDAPRDCGHTDPGARQRPPAP